MLIIACGFVSKVLEAIVLRASPLGHQIVALGGPGLGFEVHRWP